MKLVLAILLLINPLTDLDKIARVNKGKEEAEKAYLAGNYEEARTKYIFLRDSLGVKDENMMLNLANAQYILKDSVSALSNYNSLRQSTSAKVRSLAEQQLGAMQFKSKRYDQALAHYKSALKANPANDDARYNYELLKKLIKEQEEQEKNKDQQKQDQQNQDQQNQDQQNQDKQNQEQKEQQEQEKEQQEEQEEQDQQKEDEQQKKEQEEQKPEDQQKQEEKEEQSNPNPIDEEKLKEMKISEEKAKLILEAMKNNEVQYIQQNKRKAKKKKDPNKPDW